jgi:hypothetical protein
MRYLIDSQMGWLAVPFVALVGVAYMWLMDSLLRRNVSVERREEAPSVAKAA